MDLAQIGKAAMDSDSIFEAALTQTGIRLIYPGRGHICFIAQSDMPRAIVTARACSLWIVGIEGFELRDGGIYPDLGLIADYSDLTSLPMTNRIDASIQCSIAFLSQIKPHPRLAFAITVDAGTECQAG